MLQSFSKKKILAIEMRILLNKLVWLGLSILDLSETVMYSFWYEFVKPKSGENVTLYWHIFIVHVKTDENYKDFAEGVETRFDTSNFQIERPLPKGKNKKSNWTNERWISWTNYEKNCLI